VSDEELGEVRVQAVAPRFSETPGDVGPLAPRLGAHNEDVYLGLLVLSGGRARRPPARRNRL